MIFKEAVFAIAAHGFYIAAVDGNCSAIAIIAAANTSTFCCRHGKDLTAVNGDITPIAAIRPRIIPTTTDASAVNTD